MRIYVLKNKRVDFSGRTSSSTAVLEHRCPRGEGSPMREMAPAARDLKFYRAFTELFYLVDPVDPVGHS
jgi:hypothetical protein